MEAFALSEVALAEPEVVQAEAPTQEQPPIDPGDAASPAADAGATPEATPAAVDNAQVDAIVQELLQKESKQAQPEPVRQEPQVDPEVLRQADEGRTRYNAATRAGHDAIDAECDAAEQRLVDEGYSSTFAKLQVDPIRKTGHDKVNELHAIGLKDAGYASAYETNRAFWMGVEAGVPAEHHPVIAKKLEEGKYGSYKDVAADLYSIGIEAGKTAAVADVDARKDMYIRQGVEAGLAQAGRTAQYASDGQQVNGTAAVSGAIKPYSQYTPQERAVLTQEQKDQAAALESRMRQG